MNDKTAASGLPAQPDGVAEPAPRRRRSHGFTACVFGLLIGIGGLAASRLGQLWVAFDVFAQCTLQFAVITAAFVIALAVPRGRVLAAAVLMLLGGLAIGLWPQLAASGSGPAAELQPGEVALSVASFNIWDRNSNLDGVVAEAMRLDADVLALVETDSHGPALAAKLHDRYPYQSDCFDDPLCDAVILSKHPIAARRARVAWAGPSAVLAQFGPELGNLTVVAVHTIRFPHSRAQLRQVQALSRWLETIPGHRILMGDFNATPFSRMLTTLSDATGMVRLTELPSWPSWISLPQVAIDHIFVSGGLRLLRPERLGNPAGSDHYPVQLDLAVPAG